MKSFFFTALLVAITNAGYPTTYKAPAIAKAASSNSYAKSKAAMENYDFDAWGRDQDLHIDESYDKTGAK